MLASSMASSRDIPSRTSCSGGSLMWNVPSGRGRDLSMIAIGTRCPFVLMSSPSARTSSSVMRGNFSAAGWIGRTSRQEDGVADFVIFGFDIVQTSLVWRPWSWWTGKCERRPRPGGGVFLGGGCDVGAGGALAGAPFGGLTLAPPCDGGFVGNQRARADLHGGRPPPVALHFIKHVFADAVQRAEFADRHRERRATDGRRPDADTRIRFAVPYRLDCLRVRLFRRSGLPLRFVGRLRRLLPGNLSTRHRCRLPETLWETIWLRLSLCEKGSIKNFFGGLVHPYPRRGDETSQLRCRADTL